MRRETIRRIGKCLKGQRMNQDVLYFFDGKPEALPLYEAFEERVFSEVDGVKVKVQKTQIAFSNRHNSAFVSFLPVRKAKERSVCGWFAQTDRNLWRICEKEMLFQLDIVWPGSVELAIDEIGRWPFEGQNMYSLILWINVGFMKNAAEIGSARFLYAATAK